MPYSYMHSHIYYIILFICNIIYILWIYRYSSLKIQSDMYVILRTTKLPTQLDSVFVLQIYPKEIIQKKKNTIEICRVVLFIIKKKEKPQVIL